MASRETIDLQQLHAVPEQRKDQISLMRQRVHARGTHLKGFRAADFRVASRRNTMVCMRQGNMKATQGSAVEQARASSRARARQCKMAWGGLLSEGYCLHR